MKILKFLLIIQTLSFSQPYTSIDNQKYNSISEKYIESIITVLKKNFYDDVILPDYLENAIQKVDNTKKINSKIEIKSEYLILKYLSFTHLEEIVLYLKKNADKSQKETIDYLYENGNKYKITINFLYGLMNKDPRVRLFCADCLNKIGVNAIILDFINWINYIETSGIVDKTDDFEFFLQNYFFCIYGHYPHFNIDDRLKHLFINIDGDYVYGNVFEEINKIQQMVIRYLLVYKIEKSRDIDAEKMKYLSKYAFNTLYEKIDDKENPRNIPANMYRHGASSFKWLRYNDPTVKLTSDKVIRLAEIFVGGLQNRSQYVQKRSAEMLYSFYNNQEIMNDYIRSFIKKSAIRFYAGHYDLTNFKYPSKFRKESRDNQYLTEDTLRDKFLLAIILNLELSAN